MVSGCQLWCHWYTMFPHKLAKSRWHVNCTEQARMLPMVPPEYIGEQPSPPSSFRASSSSQTATLVPTEQEILSLPASGKQHATGNRSRLSLVLQPMSKDEKCHRLENHGFDPGQWRSKTLWSERKPSWERHKCLGTDWGRRVDVVC
jgi:hypothetical protein